MARLYKLYSCKYRDGVEYKNLVAQGEDIKKLEQIRDEELRSGYVDYCYFERVCMGNHSRFGEKWAED